MSDNAMLLTVVIVAFVVAQLLFTAWEKFHGYRTRQTIVKVEPEPFPYQHPENVPEEPSKREIQEPTLVPTP